ncbi:uncharacterized protein C3orf38 homolog [Diorhabda sublineata]|uniref:uncharacterized protein C3orf38 homolog n=1 Tax=Diorhabda sublineata TaxID=1163346 RepID=UPI0024E0BAB0|nr:uncharacterized protein C3orf38 homolog [Diorhabda sublineata]
MTSTPEPGIVDILSKLDEDNLLSLAKTVTQGLLKINTTEEAIKGILKYSPDAISILRRKSITREVLFSYLDDRNVMVRLPITKNELIDKILEYWNESASGINPENKSISCRNNEDSLSNSKKNENSITALAEQFAGWFFQLLNNNNVGAEHFYADAKLKINMLSNDDHNTISIENNPENIAHELLNVRMQHNLYFNPNISKEGTQGRMNPHGLVMVLVCGTLHVQETCVGVFEQVFALARDPFSDNNWKIKSTEMNLRSNNAVHRLPRLCESELTSNLLTLPSS